MVDSQPIIDQGSQAYAARQGRLCAQRRWTGGQLTVALLLGAAIGLSLAVAPVMTWLGLSAVVALLAMSTVGVRLLAMVVAIWRDPTIHCADDEVQSADVATLPRYCVLVPLYREPEVVPHLREALAALRYPSERLDIQFLVEPDDQETIAALGRQTLPGHMRITCSPLGVPRTKPRACNGGLAVADGELLVIYDAEDRPEPDQLIKAALAYRTLPADVVCLQCRLDHYNSQQSLPTRWTTIDYLMWFRLVLPGLQRLGAPIPLGGTSNHFRLSALRALDGWDPFNVTEDCDLGLRIARRGWRTSMLASTTWEEGVADGRGWINQRSRWLKGYLQTWMVQSREDALRVFGVRGCVLMSLCTIGLVGALLVNPIAWATMVLWLICGWSVVDTRSTLSMATLAVTIGLLFANVGAVAIAVGTCLRLGRRDLLGAAVISPIAWAMHSVAAWKAVWEFVFTPFHWQKTRHGQAIADVGQRRTWQGAPTIVAVSVVAVALMVFAGQRIGTDIAQQAAAYAPPVQMPLFHAHQDRGAIGLVAANNPIRPPPWRVVEALTAPPCGASAPLVALAADADFPSTPLALVSRGWRDLSGLAALACDVQVDADAPHEVRVVVHWRDEDGNWFQSLSEQRLIPGAWTRLEFPIHQPASWTALGHHRAWHPSILRRVSELGVQIFSHQTYRGQVTVANLRSLPFSKEIQDLYERAAFSLRHGAAAEVAVMSRWSMDFDLGRTWENPFDAEQVAVDLEITTPAGAIHTIPGFYTQDYARRLVADREQLDAIGAPGWRVIYRARQPGVHRWRLMLTDHGGSARELSAGAFTANPATHPGYIRRSATKPELLARDDGSFYYPLGQNLCHAVDLKPPVAYSFVTPPDQGSFTFDRYFSHMAAAGMNLARIWMTPWSYGLEGKSTWRHFHGLGRYNLANAWRLDHLLDDGEQRGINVLLTVTHMSEMATDFGSHAWEDSALNRKNGGCLANPQAFFTSPDVMKLYRQRLRYMVARWGDRPGIAAWEFFGEANLMPGFDANASAIWHQQLARYVRDLDLGRHLIFTHTHNWQRGNELWALPEIDCVQGNGYIRPPNHTPNHVLNFDRYLGEVEHFHKPVLVAEFGGRSELGVPSEDYLCGQLHSGIWASFTSPFAGAALHWWWNFVEGAELYDHYRGLSRFAAGIDRLAKDYHPVRPPVSGPGAKLFASGMQDADSGFYWVYHPDLFEHWREVPTVAEAIVHLTGLAPGRYRVEFWDTLTGPIAEPRDLQFAGEADILLPKVVRDLALKIHRLE